MSIGELFIVSTPIGNLDDITYRAIKVLNQVDIILAEDTRVSKKLLDHYNISKPMHPYHDFNKERVTKTIIEQLLNGTSYAVITDAGTPGIADPAFNLVREALTNKIKVTPIPGASALLTALVVSGLPTDRFVFENFLPHKSAQRKRLFESLVNEKRTIIVYETPHRILKVLDELQNIFPKMNVVVGRELTKLYEEFLRGTPSELLQHFTKKPPRGEMVLMFNPRIEVQSHDESDIPNFPQRNQAVHL